MTFAALLALAAPSVAMAERPAIVETVRLGALDLIGRHVRPAAAGLETILIVHDTLGAYTDPAVSGFQDAMAARGWASLAVNLSLTASARAAPLDCNTLHAHRHEDAVKEIAAWVDWLQGEGLGPVVLAGHRRGGAQAAWSLAKDMNGVAAAGVLLAPTGWTPRHADAEYRARYSAGIAALLTQIASLAPEDAVENVPFLHCGAVTATRASIDSYYGAQPLRDTPTALAETETPTLVLLPDLPAGAPDQDVGDRLQKLESAAISVQVVKAADAQFAGPAMDAAADAADAYLRSIMR